MPQLPSNVNYGMVVGQFVASVSDGEDPGFEPDATPMEGTVTFTPSVPLVRNVEASPNPVTIVKTAITGIIDDEGYLCTPQIDPNTNKYRRGITLVANDDEDLEPVGWNWVVTYRFKLNGWDVAGPPQHGLDVLTGQEVDLTEAIPVTVSNGQPIIRGPKGEKGDKGDQGVIGKTPALTVGQVNTVTTPGDDEWVSTIIREGGLTKTAIQTTMPTTFKGDKGDPGGWTTTSLGDVDLNTVQTPGAYRQPTASFANTTNNYPVNNSGILEVFNQNASNPLALVQRYTPVWGNQNGKIFYTRTLTGAAWSAWSAFPYQRVDATIGRVVYIWDPAQNKEQMIFGDTGWRKLSPGSDIFPTLTGGFISYRRELQTVHLVAENAIFSDAVGSDIRFTIPGTAASSQMFLPMYSGVPTATLHVVEAAWNGSHRFIKQTTHGLKGYVNWQTRNSWPTELVGTSYNP